MTSPEEHLKIIGPMLSGDLAKIIEMSSSVRFNTASQIISRSKDIKRIKGFFKSNQSLCYLKQHAEDGVLYDALSEAMYLNGHKYWYTLNALKLHDGIISKKYLECYTNYPIEKLAKHLPFDVVLNNFIEEEVLIFNNQDYIFSPRFDDTFTNPLIHRTIELIKDNVLNDFHSYSKNIGLISYNTGELFGEFGKFRWGFKGVSAVMGLRSGDKLGFVVGDVMLGKPILKRDVDFFVAKLKHIQSFKNASRLYPILIVDDVDAEALMYLKQQGIVVGFIKELFGSKYATGLKELISILNNAGASLKTNPDKYLELIKELKEYNLNLSKNIKGTLFEYLVGHIHSLKSRSINLGREIIENNKRHEMDVFAIYDDKIIIAECKGIKSPADLEMINNWLKNKIPAFKSWVLRQETLKNLPLEFEFWSTGGFDNDAIDKLDNMISSLKKFKVSYYGPSELREKALAMKNKKFKEALDNYFLNPMI